jgi:hypothetical protein
MNCTGVTFATRLMSMALLAGVAGTCLAQAPAATKAFENEKYRYSVALPTGCRHIEGPGTLEAVCSADFDVDKSSQASAAASFFLEVSAEPVTDDASKPATSLAQSYTEPEFKAELPETVCGEVDKARVKLENVKQVLEERRVVYSADVACPEIKFLGLEERIARVRFVITPGVRYRLFGRAPKEEFEQRKESIEAFFASFRALPGEK